MPFLNAPIAKKFKSIWCTSMFNHVGVYKWNINIFINFIAPLDWMVKPLLWLLLLFLAKDYFWWQMISSVVKGIFMRNFSLTFMGFILIFLYNFSFLDFSHDIFFCIFRLLMIWTFFRCSFFQFWVYKKILILLHGMEWNVNTLHQKCIKFINCCSLELHIYFI